MPYILIFTFPITNSTANYIQQAPNHTDGGRATWEATGKKWSPTDSRGSGVKVLSRRRKPRATGEATCEHRITRRTGRVRGRMAGEAEGATSRLEERQEERKRRGYLV